MVSTRALHVLSQCTSWCLRQSSARHNLFWRHFPPSSNTLPPSPSDSEKAIQNTSPPPGADESEKPTEDIPPWEDVVAWEQEDFHPFHFTFDFLQAFFSGLSLPPSPNEIDEAFQDISSPQDVAEQEDQSKNMPTVNKRILWHPRRNLAAFRLFLMNLLPTFKTTSTEVVAEEQDQ
ncbi:uncharacterized protein LOC144781151 isoform X2 [Lissotriton helveticus]